MIIIGGIVENTLFEIITRTIECMLVFIIA